MFMECPYGFDQGFDHIPMDFLDPSLREHDGDAMGI